MRTSYPDLRYPIHRSAWKVNSPKLGPAFLVLLRPAYRPARRLTSSAMLQ
jgi:hypothetical protein